MNPRITSAFFMHRFWKRTREEMLMKEISPLRDIVSQKEKDAETISRLLANIERLMARK